MSAYPAGSKKRGLARATLALRDAIEAHLPDGWLDKIETEEALARQALGRITRVLPAFARPGAN